MLPLPTGTLIQARYRIERLLGAGATSAVYLAHDTRLHRPVALKLLRAPLAVEAAALERLAAEARILARFQHPNVVLVYDTGQEGDQAFLVMAYVEGEPLSRLAHRPGGLTPAASLALLDDVAAALTHLHTHGVIHRDLKPDNILVTAQGRAVLVDFGLAKDPAQELTGAGQLLGTLHYMAPEQFRDSRAVTPAADLYALAVLAFELLTGRVPFGGTPSEIMAGHLNQPPPRPRDLNPALPPEVDLVFRTALAKDPRARFPNPLAFTTRLRAALTPSLTQPAAAAPSPARRRPTALGVLGLALAVGLGGLALCGGLVVLPALERWSPAATAVACLRSGPEAFADCVPPPSPAAPTTPTPLPACPAPALFQGLTPVTLADPLSPAAPLPEAEALLAASGDWPVAPSIGFDHPAQWITGQDAANGPVITRTLTADHTYEWVVGPAETAAIHTALAGNRPLLRNYRISLDLEAPTGSADRAGLLLRAPDNDNYIYFVLDGLGNVQVFNWRARAWSAPLVSVQAEAFAADQPNTLTAIVVDNRLSFYVNGVAVGAITAEVAPRGSVGVVIERQAGPRPVTFRFRALTVQQPPGWSALVTEPFNANDLGWATENIDSLDLRFDSRLTEGRFRWRYTAAQTAYRTSTIDTLTQVDDFFLTVAVNLRQAAANRGAGVAFRAVSQDKFYNFYLQPGGRFRLDYVEASNPQTMLDQPVPGGLTAETWTRVVIWAEGQTLTFCLGDFQVAAVADNRQRAGQILLTSLLGVTATEEEVVFDNLAVFVR